MTSDFLTSFTSYSMPHDGEGKWKAELLLILRKKRGDMGERNREREKEERGRERSSGTTEGNPQKFHNSAINSLSSHSGYLVLYISKAQPPRAGQHHSQIPPSPHLAHLPLIALLVRVLGHMPKGDGRRSKGTPAVSDRD